MSTILDRLYRLEALTAATPAGGPAHRISSDYGPSGDSQKGKGKGGGRHVASKAGEKRYGLPIGTPLGGTNSRRKGDADTQRAYGTFTAAKTPAELNKAASWMSNADLKRAGEALFSFDSKNERDEAARNALIRELAARGIDPHTVGYKGGPVTLNPNPKEDPTVRAANRRKKEQERAQSKSERERERKAKEADAEASRQADLDWKEQAGQALAEGVKSDKDLRAEWRNRQRGRPSRRAG